MLEFKDLFLREPSTEKGEKDVVLDALALQNWAVKVWEQELS